MIKTFCIGNFKAFANVQKILFRPITLIFGANSSGKSSIIHGLSLIHEALLTGNLDVFRTTIGGKSIDLGGFRQYIHRSDATKRVEFEFDVDQKQFIRDLQDFFGGANSVSVNITIGMRHKEKMIQQRIFNAAKKRDEYIDVPSGHLYPIEGPRIQTYDIYVDDLTILQIRLRGEGGYILDVNLDHPIIKEFIKNIILASTTTEKVTDEDLNALRDKITDFVNTAKPNIQNIFPSTLGFPREERDDLFKSIYPISKGYRKDDIFSAIKYFIDYRLSYIVTELSNLIQERIETLVYLGPLRSFPPRHVAVSKDEGSNWYAGGGYAWDVVRREPDIRNIINNWLGSEKLQTKYELSVRNLIPDSIISRELPSKIDKALEIVSASWTYDDKASDAADQFREYIRDLYEKYVIDREERDEDDDLMDGTYPSPIRDSESEVVRWIKEIAESSPDQLKDLIMIDKRTETQVTHRDVGIGISQVLPVLVYAYANKNKLITIEQPEIHLHPALQAELGDVFIESALGENKNTFLLETHSEHLILRILRRIRETAENELPKGVKPIKPEDVSVLYTKPTDKGCVVYQMNISEEGEFLDKWPDGFFAERAKELF
jgi:predicted ATPase